MRTGPEKATGIDGPERVDRTIGRTAPSAEGPGEAVVR
jgi:hypothetical protein